MKEIQVRNMISTSGNYVPNQFEIKKKVKDYYQHYFQSYDTIICKYDVKGLILDTNALHYSRTTSKYLYMYLNMDRKELLNGIKDKSIRVRNLNK